MAREHEIAVRQRAKVDSQLLAQLRPAGVLKNLRWWIGKLMTPMWGVLAREQTAAGHVRARRDDLRRVIAREQLLANRTQAPALRVCARVDPDDFPGGLNPCDQLGFSLRRQFVQHM